MINSDNQALIHHIHHFQYVFCNQNKTQKLCWFYMLLLYGLYLNSIHWVSYAFVIKQKVFILIIKYCWNNLFFTHFAFLCSLLSTKNEKFFGFSQTNSEIATPLLSCCIFSRTNFANYHNILTLSKNYWHQTFLYCC